MIHCIHVSLMWASRMRIMNTIWTGPNSSSIVKNVWTMSSTQFRTNSSHRFQAAASNKHRMLQEILRPLWGAAFLERNPRWCSEQTTGWVCN